MNLTTKDIETLVKPLNQPLTSTEVIHLFKPILDTKCPFANLDLLGRKIGHLHSNNPDNLLKILDTLIEYNVIGSYVIAGQALISLLPHDFERALTKSKEYIITGDTWYMCDIIGERCIGHAVVNYFDHTVVWLQKFFEDENRWVRRSAGVAIHFFSKRVVTQPEKTKILLKLVEPFIEEKQIDVVKGIGWGLKTIGRHHPDLLVKFLKRQIDTKKKISKVTLRKAVTYLDEDKRNLIMSSR